MSISPLRMRGLLITIFSLLLISCAQLQNNPPEAVYIPLNDDKIRLETFDAIWQKMAENELIGSFGGDEWDETYNAYKTRVEAVESDEAFQLLMEELIKEVPNSQISITPRQERIDTAIALGPNLPSIGAFTGIRDSLNEEPRLVILHIMPNSPAAKAGLAPHESIMSINGEPVKSDAGVVAQQALRIGFQDELLLLVQAPSGEQRLVTVQQDTDPPQASPIEARILPNTDFLYVKFPPNEGRNSLDDLAEAVDQFRIRASENKGIIIDTRIMTGRGRSSILQFMTLLSDGVMFDRVEDGKTEQIAVNGIPSGLQAEDGVPIVIILGQDTAGTGEIFAAALQDSERAVVIGQPSGGFVEEFETSFLPNGSQIRLPTTALITYQGRRNIGQLGVEPDFAIDSDWGSFSAADDPLLEQATDLLDRLSTKVDK